MAELRTLGRATGELGAELCVPTVDGRWGARWQWLDDGGRAPLVGYVPTFKAG